MLSHIRIKNFKCIKDLSFSLEYGERKAPNGWKEWDKWPFIEVSATSKKRLCPCLVLYGANASGKTTILTALHVLMHLVTNGVDKSYFMPNRIVGTNEKTTTLGIEFWKNRKHFSYEIRYNAESIEDEILHADNELLFHASNGLIKLKNTLIDEAVQKIYQMRAVNAMTGFQVKTFLETVNEKLPGLSEDILLARDFIVNDIVVLEGDESKCDQIRTQSEVLGELAETFVEEGISQREAEDKALALIADYMHRLDFRIENLTIEKLNDDAGLFKTWHKTQSGRMVEFRLSEESKGTRQLVVLLGIILTAIRSGKTVIADELDASLHALLVTELIRMFKLKTTNTQKAQLICTLHNLHVLNSDLLSRSEVGIVDQIGWQGTKVKRIVDDESSRNVDNFLKRYLAGQYRGIPYPFI